MQSAVVWNSSEPVFNFRHTFPLTLDPTLLDQLANKIGVVEVWHHTPTRTTPNSPAQVPQDTVCSNCACLLLLNEQHCRLQLLGLVKMSLHSFYMGYRNSASVGLSVETKVITSTLPSTATTSLPCLIFSPYLATSYGTLAMVP